MFDEVLDIIYSHEKGQMQVTLPLEKVLPTGAFMSKQSYENALLFYWQIITCSRPVTQEIVEPPMLVKISTCIYSKKTDVPVWYGNWDGKFYYDADELRKEWLLEKVALMESGFGGVDKNGKVVDRRDIVDAVPFAENRLFNTPKPSNV